MDACMSNCTCKQPSEEIELKKIRPDASGKTDFFESKCFVENQREDGIDKSGSFRAVEQLHSDVSVISVGKPTTRRSNL